MPRTLGFRCTLAAVALLCAVLPPVADSPWRARAQQPQPALSIAQVDASAYPEIRAVVTAVDANGVPVPSLTQAQFQAFDASTPLTVLSVQGAQDADVPLSVVIAFDVSGSMAGESLDRAKQAATQFVQNLGPNDTAAIVTFAATVTPLVPFTKDKPQLTNAIASLQAVGGTALYEAVQVSAGAAAASASSRRAIVLLTDGQNDAAGSTATADGSLAAARAAGAPVFTVGFGATPDAAYLQGLSASTQGQYRPATAATVSSVYADIAALLRAQYLLTLRSAAPADGKDAALRIVATIAGAPAAATASYKRGAAAVPVAPPTAVASAQPPPAATSGGGSSIALTVFGMVIALAVLVAVAFFYIRLRRRRRLHRMQRAIVEPNPRLAAAQGVPRSSGTSMAAGQNAARGRLFSLNGDAPGPAIEFGDQPISIGSGPECDVRVEPSAEVARRHALVWAREGKLMLRHVGGPTRATTVAGRPVTWVTLEEGDEFAIGAYRYRAEHLR